MKKVKQQFRKKKKGTPDSEIIRNLQAKYDSIDESKISKFSDLPLSPKTLKGLKDYNYITMTDIQRQSIGLALKGNDILGAAKTGSGKTLAFLIPILEILYINQWTNLDGLGALIITPTRELALQIYDTLCKVGKYHDFSAGLIIGGKDWELEKKVMHKCNIIICCPGRMLHHMNVNPLFHGVNLKVLVLDEADRCLDMGFEQEMNAIIENLPKEHLTLLFSATQTKSVKDLGRLSLKDPLYVSVHEHATHTTPDGLQQSYIICNLEDKIAMLWSFIRNHLTQKVIVFFSTCKQVKYINEAFCRLKPGISLLALYGSLSQPRRMAIYNSFCGKQRAVLFATDIVARGLDFPNVDWVVQMDCPEDVNTYIHRSGRTARFTNKGESLLVLLPSEEQIIERLKERKIPINMIKINPNKLYSPQKKLEALLARDNNLKESAKRAIKTYVLSITLMKDKSIFDVHALNVDGFARSLGLVVTPRIRFYEKMMKNLKNDQDKKDKKEENGSIKNFSKNEINSKIENNENDDNSSSERETAENDKYSRNENKLSKVDHNFGNFDSDDDEDILTIKRKNIDIDEILPEEIEVPDEKLSKQKKPITKAAAAKKFLKKNILPNKKINFNEEGEEVIDPTKSKVSELAKQYDKEDVSGINIEIAKKVLQEEDKFDKQRFREKIKQKHKEEKRKLKEQRKGKKIEEEQGSEEEFESGEISDGSEGPDLSWLPDPDKIYGEKQKSDEDQSNDDEVQEQNSDSSELENEEDEIHRPSKKLISQKKRKKTIKEKIDEDNNSSQVESDEEELHRPSKRKLISENKHKKKRKISLTLDDNLQADEELALQLLRR